VDGVLRVAVDVAAPIGVFGVLVRRTVLVEVRAVLGFVRMIGVETEGDADEGTGDKGEVGEGVSPTGTSVGKGIPDSSVKGVEIAGSVPR